MTVASDIWPSYARMTFMAPRQDPQRQPGIGGPWARAVAEFKSWHTDPRLYREIYTLTVASIVAVLVLYGVGTLAGVFPVRTFVRIIATACLVASVALIVYIVTWYVFVGRRGAYWNSMLVLPLQVALSVALLASLIVWLV